MVSNLERKKEKKENKEIFTLDRQESVEKNTTFTIGVLWVFVVVVVEFKKFEFERREA